MPGPPATASWPERTPCTTPGRFPITIIQHAVWLYHRFPLSDRDVQELLHQRGIVIKRKTLREWRVEFGPLFADGLRHREPHRGSRWFLDEVCTTVDGVQHWSWRAVDEHGFVLDILFQRHRGTEAAKAFLTRLLGEYDVPDRICTDKLVSYGAAIRQIASLVEVNHKVVISTARCNNLNLIEQRASAVIGAVLLKTTTGIQVKETNARISEPPRPHPEYSPSSRTCVPASTRRNNQKNAFQTWSTVAAEVV